MEEEKATAGDGTAFQSLENDFQEVASYIII